MVYGKQHRQCGESGKNVKLERIRRITGLRWVQWTLERQKSGIERPRKTRNRRYDIYICIGSAVGEILTGAVFLWRILLDIKTKEHHAGAELPKTLAMLRKNWPRKACGQPKKRKKSSCCRRRRTEWAVRIQAARKKVRGSAVEKTGEGGREVASSSGNMLPRARPQGCNSARTPAGDQQEYLPAAMGPPTRRFGKPGGPPHTARRTTPPGQASPQ